MFAKPLNLIIVYILTIINFAILLAPFVAIIVGAVHFNQEFILEKVSQINFKLILNILLFTISFMMLFYLFLDFIFGFSVRSSLKDCKNYESLEDFKFLEKIFEQVKEKFGRKDVKLYISKSNEINAFAVGSLGRQVIVLTKGMISHSLNNSSNRTEFLLIIRSIMGHEMSHLVNKDYLPALLMIVNQKTTNFISRLLELTIKIPLTILGYVRVRSRILADIVMLFYSLINKIVTLFNEKIIFHLYEFIRKFISRSVEYRCDRQSALAFGGKNMALALSLFGNDGYFTLFSTHPNTQSRIDKVQKVEIKKSGKIRPLISSSVSNYLALMLLFITCAMSAKITKVDQLVRYYLIENHDVTYQKMLVLWHKFLFLVEFAKKMLAGSNII